MYKIENMLILLLVGIVKAQPPVGFVPDDLYSDCMAVADETCISCNGLESLSSYRTFDGTCNNLQDGRRNWGSANTKMKRMIAAEYHATQKNYPRGFFDELPTPNEVSSAVFTAAGTNSHANSEDVTVLFMTFGQFMDHDLTLGNHQSSDQCGTTCTPGSLADHKYPCFPRVLQRNHAGCRKFVRTFPACPTDPNDDTETREQLNTLTAYIDGSMVYGSKYILAKQLRDIPKNAGQMKVQNTPTGDLLPEHVGSIEDCKDRTGKCFLAGDVRVNENVALASMHTLWVRKHNQIATDLKELNDHWGDTKIYEETRRIVIALIQHITFTEFLPLLYDVPTYSGYSNLEEASIINGFAAAAYRFGHSLVPNSFSQNKPEDLTESAPDISLQDAFFHNKPIIENGIEGILLGLIANKAEDVDTTFSEGLKNKLFVPLTQSLQEDLTALNIQRGRDHGIPPYVKWREHCGLSIPTTFTQLEAIPGFENKAAAFQSVYSDVSQIDLFVAGLTEKHVDDFMVGPTFQCIIKKQFEQLRKGDRYWYENQGVFTQSQYEAIKKVNMKQIFCDVITDLQGPNRGLQDRVFEAISTINTRTECSSYNKLDVTEWNEIP